MGKIPPCSNSYLDKDLMFLSNETALYRASKTLKDLSLVYNFEGGSRGLRCIFISDKGSIFVSPEGNHLGDAMKGVWKSEDKGVSWACVLNLCNYNNPVCIWGIDQSTKGNLFVGVYTLAAGESRAEIYRGCDDGTGWQLVYKNEMARHIHQITCDKYTGHIYASVGDNFSKWRTKSILRSKDEGDTWDVILPELPQVVPVMALKGARLFASDAPGGARIYRTTDDKYAELVLCDPDELYFYWMRNGNDDCILASAIPSSKPCRYAKIYRSLNKGLSWHLVQKFEANSLFDGSMNASNISGSFVVLHVSKNGTVKEPLATDLADLHRLQVKFTLPDIVSRLLALLLLLLSLPVILISALLILLTSRGPVFYFQTRNGMGGDSFRIIKLRTRFHNGKKHSWSQTELTPVGKILRCLSIDELPQLWNVIAGEMALVGPRPHPLALDVLYQNDIPGIFKRYVVKPGMTGLAQVSGARGQINCLADMYKRVRLDILYIRKRSILLDVVIILKTIWGGFIHRREAPVEPDKPNFIEGSPIRW